MIRYSCPKCSINLKSADDKAGTKTTCPRCGERLEVPAGASAAAAKSKQTESDADDGASGSGAKKSKAKSSAVGSKKPVILYAGIGLAVCGIVAVVAMVASSMGGGSSGGKELALKSGGAGFSRRTPPPSAPPSAPPPVAPKATAPEGEKKPDDQQGNEPAKSKTGDKSSKRRASPPEQAPASPDAKPPKTDDAPPDPGEAAPGQMPVVEGGAKTGEQLYKEVLKSTAFVGIIIETGPNSAVLANGTATLIDRKNKLILTNQHVSTEATKGRLFVTFPMYDKGHVVIEKAQYFKSLESHDAIPGFVEFEDKHADLAIIRLSGLPDNVSQIRFAHESVVPGQMLYSLGNPGAAPAIWIWSTGQARSYPHHHKWKSILAGQEKEKEGPEPTQREAIIVESQSPVNPGDSGGPVVNDRCELVGVTQGQIQASLLNIFIDISEVRRFRDAYYKSKGLTPPEDAGPTLQVARDLPTLIRSLHDRSSARKISAAGQLESLGPEAKSAVPDLIEMLQDKDDNVRIQAAKAIKEIGSVSSADLQKVIEAMKERRLANLRVQAIGIIKRMGEEADTAVPALIECLKDSDSTVRLEAAKTLESLGPLAKSAVPALAYVLQSDKNSEVRSAASLAIGKIHSDDHDGIKALEAGLRDIKREVRLSSLTGIQALGSDGKQAVPQLLKTLKEKDREIRQQTIVALGAIGPDAKEAIEKLISMMDDKELYAFASTALGKIGKDAVKPLTTVLGSPNKNVRRGAIDALGEIGPAARMALRSLLTLAQKDPEPANREAATAAYKKILEQP